MNRGVLPFKRLDRKEFIAGKLRKLIEGRFAKVPGDEEEFIPLPADKD